MLVLSPNRLLRLSIKINGLYLLQPIAVLGFHNKRNGLLRRGFVAYRGFVASVAYSLLQLFLLRTGTAGRERLVMCSRGKKLDIRLFSKY
jgi:hypothetical protein